MAQIYQLKKGSPSKKTRKPASVMWKQLLLLSGLLNLLQFVAYILKR